ncbi:MAG: hydrogen gas-evolving membrane-bound hydrogenase subunit E, partial [Burkholderiaceae bacterium]
AGIIDHETGTRDIRKLSGLFRFMPFTATLAMVASAAMAGVPLVNGFLSKEMFFAETVFISSLPWVEFGLPFAATVAGIFAVVYSLRFSYDIFFGPLSVDLPREPHEPPRWMRVPIDLLVLACLVVGIAPAWSIGGVLAVAAAPVVGGPLPPYSLAIWHGFNAPLMMSLVAMVGGTALYMALRRRLEQGRLERVPLLHPIDGRRLFELGLVASSRLARSLLGLFGTRRLQPQLFWLVVAAVLAAALALGDEGLSWGDRPRVPASPIFALLWLIGGACAVGAAVQAKYHRLAALIMVSVTGLVTCLTFVWFSAPDLALTQIAVEVVTTVLFLLGLRWLPQRNVLYADRTRVARLRRARDAVLAGVVGAGLAALAFALLTRPAPQSISPFFIARALSEGGGSNIVNVMLVDFRSLDTLGEITVLGAVALTVYALLRRFRPPVESIETPRQQRAVPTDRPTDLINPRIAFDTALGYLLVPAVLVRLVLPIAGVVAIHLFLRGHNEPGGGFVAGLVVAAALITQSMVAGTSWVEAHLSFNPVRWIASGLLFALITGLGALAFGYPFLTTHTVHLTLPLIGELPVASAMFFDLGVFTTVVGATLLILTAIAHQS